MRILIKLCEECGELVQAAMKMQMCFTRGESNLHWDGKDNYVRMEDEIADVIASIEFASARLGLDKQRIRRRAEAKKALYNEWGF